MIEETVSNVARKSTSCKALPPLNVLEEFLHYNPETGVFTWRKTKARGQSGKRAGCLTSIGYRSIKIQKHRCLEHRLAWKMFHKEEPPPILDHVNRCPGDNRITNLRPATHGENHYNCTARKKSSFLPQGVAMAKRNPDRFRAQIHSAGKHIHLGYYDTAEEAAQRYQQARKELCGEYAPTEQPL